jgi:acetoin utilization protein AcuB
MTAKATHAARSSRVASRAIEHFMTPSPHSIGVHQPLSLAHAMMRAHKIRHLPVLDGGKLVGVLSQRDLYFVETLKDAEPENVEVGEAMTYDAYVVGCHAPIDGVAEHMAQQRLGCAVVVEGGHLRGIFTTSDALVALVHLVREARRSK